MRGEMDADVVFKLPVHTEPWLTENIVPLHSTTKEGGEHDSRQRWHLEDA